MKSIKTYAIGLAAMLLASCSTPKDVVYFQDVHNGSEILSTLGNEITVQPKDKLSIFVSTADERLTNQFNLSLGSNSSSMMQRQGDGIGYTVDSKGNIDFPVIGSIHVEGLTREGVANLIKEELTSRNLVKNPVVIVSYLNLSVAVLGEVKRPGRVDINKDKITILDAIAEAGDLTLDGQRENVMIIRGEGTKQQVYTIDMTNAESVYGSPVYYLEQDDVIYVAPNEKAQRNSTVNGNTLQTYGFWMSFVSFLMSVAVFAFK